MNRLLVWITIVCLLPGCASEAPEQASQESRIVGTSAPTNGDSPSKAKAESLPARPEELKFEPVAFEAPMRSAFRKQLRSGVSVFLLPTRELPLVDIQLAFRGGSHLDPAGKEGLTQATATMLRRGGTTTHAADVFDEEVDFLASQISTDADGDRCSASLLTLSANLQKSLALLFDMLRNPGFDADRFGIYKDDVLESIRQRNDRADAILSREWAMHLYGTEHYLGRFVTKDSLGALTIDDLRAQHRRIFHPGNLLISVTGDFDEQAMLKVLDDAAAGWVPGEANDAPPPPPPDFVPGLLHAAKDIPQGKVCIGMRSLQRDHPDYIPLLVLNNILGGSSFGSRLGNVIRTEEGLAYSISSRLEAGIWFPGEWTTQYQSKNRSVALAAKLVMREIEKVRESSVTEKELGDAKQFFIDSFPRTFETKRGAAQVFVRDEMTRRPEEYWRTFRDKVRALTVADMQRVARTYLRPEAMSILVVGKWDEIAAGDERAKMSEFFGGKVTHLPERDPLTLAPVKPKTPETKPAGTP